VSAAAAAGPAAAAPAPPAAAGTTGAALGAESAPQWVFFRDRGPATAVDSALAVAERALSQRALARRARAVRERGSPSGSGTVASGAPTPTARLVDERDLEPSAAYVQAVAAAGADIRTRSRWLNAVSVSASSDALDRIRALPFVSSVAPVALGRREDLESSENLESTESPESSENLESTDGSESPGNLRATSDFSYGPGEHQVEMLGVPEAHALGYRGEGVLICVIDSGFDLRHEAFDMLEVLAERDFIDRDTDTSYDPAHDLPNQPNHGSQVLSIVGGYAPGRLIGPAYRAEYLLAKAERIDYERPSEEDAWCEALEWAEAMGADIVTSSISYSRWYRPQDLDGRSAVITRAANLALERGVLVVNSAGNYGPEGETLSAPADAPGVITVGSVNWNGVVSGFSSRGPTWDRRVKPDLVAMGSGTRFVGAQTRAKYGSGSGTSYSTPLVAGCAALVMSAHPDWGPEAVREALVMSADRASRPDPRYGWGLPNARDAILYPAVEGRVTDFHTGEPIAGAKISWEATSAVDSAHVAPSASRPRGSTAGDSTGAYVVPNLPAGVYRLRVTSPGYFDWESAPLQVPPALGDVNAALRYRGE
jgi:subtilisin family serine protease